MRKRAEAMEALTKIEIEFAKLRDLLYIERLADIERERIGIETGTHPELIHLTHLIELRRNRKLELARKWLDGLEGAYRIQIEEREYANWHHWEDERGRTRSRMLDEANSKRRRLEREKRVLEKPKDDSLGYMLAPRPPPAVPLHYRRRVGFDGEALADNEIGWALRHPDVRADASVAGLDDDAMYDDLERMGLREPTRQPIYPYEHLYGPHALPHSPYPDHHSPAHQMAPGYPYSPYDHQSFAMQQQHAFGNAFPALPPLPPRPDQVPTRPSSNPRMPSGYPGDHAAAQGFGRAYPNGQYPSNYAAHEAERMHSAAWAQQHQHKPYASAIEQEQRRRTTSAGGALGGHGSHDSLDAVAGHHRPNGYPADELAKQNGGGRTTPVPGGNAAVKARFTLDEHMSHRSPKTPAGSSSAASSSAPTSVTKPSSAAAASRNAPAPFMSIPTIPPFDRHRHEQHLLAQAQARSTTPGAPGGQAASTGASSMPALAKSSSGLFGQASAAAAATAAQRAV
ncbi:hypothetical protein BJY59DRAFT_694803 [Rhodotorula toruloides]